MHTTTCCFHMSTPNGGGGWETWDARGERKGLWRQRGWRWCNLTQSCVLGMTSLGGPCRSPVPGNCVRARDWREEWSGERGRNEPWIPSFYLACDGEIQINSCQSGGPQGEGLWWWGGEGGMEKGRSAGAGVGGDRAWLMGVSVNRSSSHHQLVRRGWCTVRDHAQIPTVCQTWRQKATNNWRNLIVKNFALEELQRWLRWCLLRSSLIGSF